MPDPARDYYSEILREVQSDAGNSSTAVAEPSSDPAGDYYQEILRDTLPQERRSPDSPRTFTDNIITDIVKKAAAETSVGLAARAAGLSDYEEKDLGLGGNVAAGVLGFVGDPATWFGGGLAKAAVVGFEKIIGKEAAKKLVAYSAREGIGPFAARSAVGAIKPAVVLGTVAGARDPFQQLLETGSFSPLHTAGEIAKSTAVGALFGPAGQIPTTAGKIAGEVGAMLVPPLVEKGSLDQRDIEAAIFTVAGMRLTGVAMSKLAGLPDKPSRSEFADATGEEGRLVRSAEGRAEAVRQAREVETNANQRSEVQGIRGAEEVGTQQGVGGENRPLDGGTGSVVTPEAQAAKEIATPLSAPQEPGFTGTKKAVIDAEREIRGADPIVQAARRSRPDVMAEAERRYEENPGAVDELLAEIQKDPRPARGYEEGMLLLRKSELTGALNRAAAELKAAKESGDPARIAAAEAAESYELGQSDTFERIRRKSGSEWSISGQMAQSMIQNDYSLDAMLRRERENLGTEKLSPDMEQKVREDHRAIAEKSTGHEAAIAGKETARVIDAVDTTVPEIVKKFAKERSKRSVQAKADVDAAWKDLLDNFPKDLFANPFLEYPELVVRGVKLARAYIRQGIVTFADFMAEAKKRLGEERAKKSEAVLKQSWDKAIEEERPQPKSELTKPSELTSHARELAEYFVGVVGIRERGRLVDAIHGELQKLIPNITRRQTAEAFVAYGQFTLLDKDATKVIVRDLRGQERESLKLEDMASGVAPLKSGREFPTPSDTQRRLTKLVNEAKKKGGYAVTDPERQLRTANDAIEANLTHQIADLEAQIAAKQRIVKERKGIVRSEKVQRLQARRDELNVLLDEIAPQPGRTEEQRQAAYKTSLRKRIAELEDKTARGDFEPRKRTEVKADAEIERLRFERDRAIDRYRANMEARRRALRSTPQKIFEGGQETLNFARANLTSADLSATARHGGFFLAAHPVRAFDIFRSTFGTTWSEAKASREAYEISQRPNAKNGYYKRGHLQLTSPHGKLSGQEEVYMSYWARKLPWIAASERVFVAYLNRMRADTFDALVATLGRNGNATDAQLGVMGNFVNVGTGRGNLGKFNAASVPMATVFFAPKYVVSRFQLLIGQPLWKGDFQTRKLIATEYARALTGVAVFYGISATALEALLGPPSRDKDGWNIETDPRSSDFGKVRIGQSRIDPLFGLQQATVLLARVASGQTKTLKGRIRDIRGKKVQFGTGNTADVLGRFARTKLSPWLGTAIDIAAGRDVIGRPVTTKSVAGNMLIPISMQGIYDAMKVQNVPTTAALSILDILGVSVQTYDTKKTRRAG